MSASYLLVNQQSLADIVLCVKHFEGQLVLEKSPREMEYFIFHLFWGIAIQILVYQLGIKIFSRCNVKRRQAVSVLQASKQVRLITASHIWQEEKGVGDLHLCSLSPLKTTMPGILRPQTPEMTLL